MPDTPIDQSNSIQSIRLKVPTGTVPVPPVGFGQLHSPSPGVLALRLPDGGVVEVGPAASGGGSGLEVTHFTQAMLLDLHNTAVDIWPAPAANEAVLPRRIVTRFVPAVEAPADYEFAPETSVFTYYGTAFATGSADTAFLPFADQTGCVSTLTVPMFGGPNGGPTANYRGQPLRLKLDLPLTAGNGTLDVAVVADVVAI